MFDQPQSEHHWLQRFVGKWNFETECDMGPDQPPMKSKGHESIRSLGGLWIVSEGIGTTPDGQDSQSMMTLGYDPKIQSFVGTFIASMMSHLWPYCGKLDADGKTLNLDSEGPSFSGNGQCKYIDSFEFVDDNTRLLTSKYQNEDGSWTQFMTATYRRIVD